MRSLALMLSVAVSACSITALGQNAETKSAVASPYYSRVNTFGFFAGYSHDSSHILLGIAENRRLLNFGAVYNRRLFRTHAVAMEYSLDLLPIALESDPVDHYTVTITGQGQPSTFSETAPTIGACHSNSGSGTEVVNGKTLTYTFSNQCSRRWTIGEGMSPVGFQWNFMPRRKLQPFLIGHGGYMYSTQPIPVEGAGSFIFTFDFGVGLELFRSRSKSIRADYRYHHISNHDTAYANPGIDNGVFQVTYAFGR
jgi:hypothetical protein